MQLTSLSLALSRIAGGWSPISLFAAGEQGAWYQPSDLSTLFQDAAGTTPVTGVEQPVGLMLDKSKGLALGSELITNGDFSNGTTGWTAGNSTLSVVDGYLRVTNTGAVYGYAYQTEPTTIGAWYKVSFTSRSGTAAYARCYAGTSAGSLSNLALVAVSGQTVTGYFVATATTTYITVLNANTTDAYWDYDNVSVKQIAGNHAFQATTSPAKRPILSARVNLLLATATLSTQSVTTQATSYNLYFTGTGSITLSGTATGTYSAGINTITCTAGTLTLTVSGSVLTADLRPANIGNNIPAYQRVNTATDYDTAGFPLYLNANGASTSMSTNSIDFSATDKMTVVSGVRKLSDAAVAILAELSINAGTTNTGSFYVTAPEATGANGDFRYKSSGTVFPSSLPSGIILAPTSKILTGESSISTPLINLRINGTQAATSSTSQGTGNYGNYPLYLFARNNASLFFNGQFYGAIIRGATTSGNDLISTESYMNNQSGGLY